MSQLEPTVADIHGRQYSKNIKFPNMICCIFFFSIDKDIFHIILFFKNLALLSPCGIQSDLRLFEFDVHSNVSTFIIS
jgi:hypothetical protein